MNTNLLASILEYEQMKQEEEVKRLNDPEYTKAYTQWGKSFVKKLKPRIKAIFILSAVSLFLWLIVIILSIVSLVT